MRLTLEIIINNEIYVYSETANELKRKRKNYSPTKFNYENINFLTRFMVGLFLLISIANDEQTPIAFLNQI